MPYDVIIRNGTVVDGTGSEARDGDVAIDGDRIAAVGDLSGSTATREIDAAGLTVTPGFVDLHTHLDAQVGWDPLMTSSSWHGVTTVLMGNCGVTFAPVRPESREYLAEMMESVEDIPREAIVEGLPWDWATFPEYLDSVQRMEPALNVVGLVGHCAVRYHAMGERSLTDEEPTPEELAQMADIAEESLAGGAVGYSTSRLIEHVVPDGRCVPGTYSSIEEYLAIADGMNRAGGGLFQAVLDFDGKAGHEFGLLHAMAERAGDVLFSGGVGTDKSGGGSMGVVDGFDAFLKATGADAGRITSAAMSRPSGTLSGLVQVPPVAGRRWAGLMALATLADRVEALHDDETRSALIEEGRQNGLWYKPEHVYPLGFGELPDFNLVDGVSVADLADRAGVHPIEVIVDRMIESEGRELYNTWFFNRHVEALGEFLCLDDVCPSLADTGAHAGQICDADVTTHYLSYWQRDRAKSTLPAAIHKLTGQPAAVLGLVERGTLQQGSFADVNVFDHAALEPCYPTYVNDFPGGKGRLQVRAKGYAATLVNGQVVTEQGEHTGVRPGRVIRDFSRN